VEKDIFDIWKKRASAGQGSEVDALRKVLDPSDARGIKNSYIDAYLKHYLRRYLSPDGSDILLEVGCGIGRLTEYMSQFVHAAYGIDIIDGFIDDCIANPKKNKNTYYLHSDEISELKEIRANKMYIVWVLMYLIDKAELIKALNTYRGWLPDLKTAVVIEQVKSSTQLQYREGKIYCCYRTIEEYLEIFAMSGFKVESYHVLGERHNGFFYKLVHIACNVLPRALVKYADKLFYIDKFMLGGDAGRIKLINSKRPTDVLFRLELPERGITP